MPIQLGHGDVTRLARSVGRSRAYVSRALNGAGCPFELALQLVLALREIGHDVSVEELVRPETPWPLEVRFLSCDPKPGEVKLSNGEDLVDELVVRRMERRELEQRETNAA